MVVLAPFVAVPLGALLADEQVSTGLTVGGLLVLAGVFLGAMSKEYAAQPAVEEAAPKKL